MDTRAIALTIVFTAVAISLSLILIPAMFLGNTYYHFFEIPIVAAFLLLGPKSGVTVAVLRTVAEMTLLPSPTGFIGPPIALLGTLNMLLGLYVANRLLKRKVSPNNLGTKPVKYFTALGTFSSVALSPIITYLLYGIVLPLIGISFSSAQIIALIPLIMLFALTLCLYSIPIGYLIARTASRNLMIGNQL